MRRHRKSSNQTQFVFVGLIAIFTISSACRPLKLNGTRNVVRASGDCTESPKNIPGTCLADKSIYLLHSSTQGSIDPKTPNTLNFGKQNLIKGDKLFAFGRFSFPPTGRGSSVGIVFQANNVNLSPPLTQYSGDQSAGVSAARSSLYYQVPEALEAPVLLRSLPASPMLASSSEGGLLIFRETKLSEAFSGKQSLDPESLFPADMLDSDKLLNRDVTISSSAVPLLKIEKQTSRSHDLVLLRAGVSWQIAEGKTNDCLGVGVTLQLSADNIETTSDGPFYMGLGQTTGTSSMQFLKNIGDDPQPKEFSLSIKADKSSRAGATNCVFKILEPATISAIVFRPVSEFRAEMKTAMYLQDSGVVTSGAATRFATSVSGPPIETILNFNWDHNKNDTLLTDVNVTLGAENRVQPTKVFVQLSRAPDGLSSHIATKTLQSPDHPRNLTLSDFAIEENASAQTKFYLTGMGFDNDAKPVAVNAAQIIYMHFRRVMETDAPQNSSSLTQNLQGRRVDLYAVRASYMQTPMAPDLDKLPCGFFRQGPAFQIPAVAGGPPLTLPGPVQNNFAGIWIDENNYTFRLSAYKRLYHDAGVLDWSLTPPAALTTQYIPKLFNVTITNSTKAGCSIAAKEVNQSH